MHEYEWLIVEDDPGLPPGDINSPMAGLDEATTVQMARLEEGKKIGTASLSANVLKRDARIRARGLADATVLRGKLRLAAKNVQRSLNPILAEAGDVLAGLMQEWLAGDLTYNEMRQQSSTNLRQFYEQVRAVGRAAAGLERLGVSTAILREEETWFRGAVREELKYWHTFLSRVNQGKVSAGRIFPRVEAYVRALRYMFEAARVQALPDSVLLYWIGPKPGAPGICAGCTQMMEWSPFPKELVPAVPRDGCVTGPNALVLTQRGQVPIADVQVGDEVRTHRGRWRSVSEVFVHRARAAHRYVVVVAPGGRLLGLTDDHRVWTADGWVEAREAARRALRVVRNPHEGDEQDGSPAMPPVRAARGGAGQANSLCRLDVGVVQLDEIGRTTLRSGVGRQRREVALHLPLPVGVGAGARLDSAWGGGSPRQRRPVGRQVGELGVLDASGASGHSSGSAGQGWAAASAVHRRATELGVLNVRQGVQPLPQVLPETAALLLDGVQKRGLQEAAGADLFRVRSIVPQEPIGKDQGQSYGGGLLLSSLLQRQQGTADPVLSVLQKDLQEGRLRDQKVEVGQVLLLQGVLRQGALLYDIAVDEDRSFIANGLAVHNSTPCLANCRHKVVVRVASSFNDVVRRKGQLERAIRSPRTRAALMKRLTEIKEAAHGRRRALVRAGGRASNPFRGEPLPRVPTYRGRVGALRMILPEAERFIVHDRYSALGIARPDPGTVCRGHCEGIGAVPVLGPRPAGWAAAGGDAAKAARRASMASCEPLEEPWHTLWLQAEAKSPTDDGWHFVVCPDCGGSGRRDQGGDGVHAVNGMLPESAGWRFWRPLMEARGITDPDDTFTVRVKESSAGGLRSLIDYIGKTADIGHSFEVVVDPDDSEYRKRFDIDGDGPFRLEIGEGKDDPPDADGCETAGIFLRVPRPLDSQFPGLGEDKSPPHCTMLFVGKVDERGYEEMVKAAQEVCRRLQPFVVEMTDYGEFSNPKGQTISHMIPRALNGPGLAAIHEMLYKAVTARGIAVQHIRSGAFKPHVTLAYVDKGKRYKGPRPAGTFRVDALEVWGSGVWFEGHLGNTRVPLGGAPAVALAEASVPGYHRQFDAVPYSSMDLRDAAQMLVRAARARDVRALIPLIDRVISTVEHTTVAVEGRPRGSQVAGLLRQAFAELVDALEELPESVAERALLLEHCLTA